MSALELFLLCKTRGGQVAHPTAFLFILVGRRPTLRFFVVFFRHPEKYSLISYNYHAITQPIVFK
ncbi:MAG: hypothetical protein IKI11_04670 [Neisseriaceae bacterium]|nr:hypothetical protein [Neisseriaceae bacterium]